VALAQSKVTARAVQHATRIRTSRPLSKHEGSRFLGPSHFRFRSAAPRSFFLISPPRAALPGPRSRPEQLGACLPLSATPLSLSRGGGASGPSREVGGDREAPKRLQRLGECRRVVGEFVLRLRAASRGQHTANREVERRGGGVLPSRFVPAHKPEVNRRRSHKDKLPCLLLPRVTVFTRVEHVVVVFLCTHQRV